MQYTSIATTAVLGLSIPGPRGREHRLGAMTRIRRQDEDTWRGRLKAGMGSSAPSRLPLMSLLMLLSRWAQSTGEGMGNSDTRFRRRWPQRCARTLHRLPSLWRPLAFDCNTRNVGGGRQVPLGVDAMPQQLATNPHMGVTARSAKLLHQFSDDSMIPALRRRSFAQRPPLKVVMSPCRFVEGTHATKTQGGHHCTSRMGSRAAGSRRAFNLKLKQHTRDAQYGQLASRTEQLAHAQQAMQKLRHRGTVSHTHCRQNRN